MKERSPKFPFIPLSEAVAALRKIDGAIRSGQPFTRPTLLEALGFASEHGGAVKTIAALRGYHLIAGKGPEQPGLRITDLGRRLLDAGAEVAGDRLSDFRRAALWPPMFRRIWRRARHLTEDELVDLLRLRGFTDTGAARAASVYMANSAYARLEELNIEPDFPDKPRRRDEKDDEPRPRDRKLRERVEAAMRRAGQAPGSPPPPPRPGPPPNALSLPLSTGRATVPLGITEEEFQVLMQTLRLWKPKLVKDFKPPTDAPDRPAGS
ncbi:MAG: hypothetical protein KDM91_22720 [Verrucomicrobiae bacterium]|nr:hypothetical protein [Verrucomicrobiae bacterium]